MFCCTCAGSCNHIGPHSFCPAHGGVQTYTYTASGTSFEPLSVELSADPCHCRSANLIVVVVAVAMLYAIVGLAILAWVAN